MASDDGRFDTLLLNIAQNQSGGIDGLLDIYFGFLRRKTDFFTGQPADVQKRTILQAMERQAAIAERSRPAPKPAAAPPVPSSSPDEGVVELSADGAFDASEAATAYPQPTPQQPSPAAAAASSSTPSGSEEDDSGPSPAGMGNGGVTDKYSWTQTLQDVQVSVGVPAAIKGRDIVCDISGSHIKFGLRGQDPIVDAPLAKPVKADDCYWTLESSGASRTLDIYLQKANGMEWWNCIAEGEPTIDTSKVEPESSKLEDLDAETRKTVEKMMFDQRQKMMNKPTSDEMRKQEMLQRFMAQHPEMDFSQAKIQ